MMHAVHTSALGGAYVPSAGGYGRDVTRLHLLETLFHRPAISRAELGRVLGLSRATVATFLVELERAGVIEQQSDDRADGPRGKGRPPLQVSLAPDAAFAVGLDIGHRHIRAVVCDLRGQILAMRAADQDAEASPDVAMDMSERLAREVLAMADVDWSRVIGVGIGLAASIDQAEGSVYPGGAMPKWIGIHPARDLQARLKLPVQLENDANTGAVGELLFGAGRGVTELVYLRLSAGVGLGIIVGGSLLRGASGVAGELGHTMAVENGSICQCGGRGCLETVVSPAALARLLEPSRGESISQQRLIQLVAEGDRGAQRAVADAGTEIGRAIASVVSLLNPELVIVGGDLAESGDVLLDPIRIAIARHAVSPASAAVRVVGSELGERAEVLGAAASQLARAPQELMSRIVGSAAAA
jgi:predicted NBD/HSP70 family sugar kinase